MKSDKPFRKSITCGFVLLVIIAIIIATVGGVQKLSYRLGLTLPPWLIAIIATGIWGYFSKKAWSWARFGITVLVVFVGFNLGPAFLRAIAPPGGTGWSVDDEIVEFNHVRDSQQDLAKKLDAVNDAATLVLSLDGLTDSANQLKIIVAKDERTGVTQSEASKKKVHDAAFETGKAFAMNYRRAADAVPKYDSDPAVVAAWGRLKAAAEPMFK
jgi:hypothetical protein